MTKIHFEDLNDSHDVRCYSYFNSKYGETSFVKAYIRVTWTVATVSLN